MDVLIEQRLLAIFPDRGPVRVHLRVGRPLPHAKGDYACPVQAEGLRLWEGPTDIVNVDPWRALMLALRFLREIFTNETERGAVFHWEDGEHALSIEELFGLDEIEEPFV